ncbi:HEAT repeat domain-containing protein [Rhodohalobacter mucosus]|uniref:HEAT repeat protein n=1 Tax=Rhodohalobacter mucosus TaxID=2079485 RepID=A0A316TMH1_9BACT|nr:HEAT repeat domain-containing protein [Rhodohalobacter mucosus]PWN05610.1 hypothetical protein DDZ15_13510 [Rhodohalobacter mucosus]
MKEILQIHSDTIVLGVVLFLGLLSAVVFAGAVYSRWRINKYENRKVNIRRELSDRLIRYVSGDLNFSGFTSGLSGNMEFPILLELAGELDKSLEGDEESRLKKLLNLPEIRSYYAERFHSPNPLEKAKACLYMARKDVIKKFDLPRIMKLTADEHPMLAYSACLAILKHGNDEQAATAIRNALKNRGLSNQALNDIFVALRERSEQESTSEAEFLMELIHSGCYNQDRRALMIRTLGELGYYESADFLLNEFYALPEKGFNAGVLISLIETLAQFGMTQILDRLRSDFILSDNSDVRLAVARAMENLREEENIPFLKWLMADKGYYVRYYAAKSLSGYSGVDLKDVPVPTMSSEELEEMIGEIETVS